MSSEYFIYYPEDGAFMVLTQHVTDNPNIDHARESMTFQPQYAINGFIYPLLFSLREAQAWVDRYQEDYPGLTIRPYISVWHIIEMQLESEGE